MKHLAALVTALAVLGFGASAFACDGSHVWLKSQHTADGSDSVPIPPPAKG